MRALINLSLVIFLYGLTQSAFAEIRIGGTVELRDSLQAYSNKPITDQTMLDVRKAIQTGDEDRARLNIYYLNMLADKMRVGSGILLGQAQNPNTSVGMDQFKHTIEATRGQPLTTEEQQFLAKWYETRQRDLANSLLKTNKRVADISGAPEKNVHDVMTRSNLADSDKRVFNYDFSPSGDKLRQQKIDERKERAEKRKSGNNPRTIIHTSEEPL